MKSAAQIMHIQRHELAAEIYWTVISYTAMRPSQVDLNVPRETTQPVTTAVTKEMS